MLQLLELIREIEIILLVLLEIVHIAFELGDDHLFLVCFDAQWSVILR